jgi:hypothetical protein
MEIHADDYSCIRIPTRSVIAVNLMVAIPGDWSARLALQ